MVLFQSDKCSWFYPRGPLLGTEPRTSQIPGKCSPPELFIQLKLPNLESELTSLMLKALHIATSGPRRCQCLGSVSIPFSEGLA